VRRLALLAVPAVVAVAVRLPVVWRDPLSQDEVFSARILSASSIDTALHRIVRTESTPPLWYVLGWSAHHLGVPVTDVRLLSVLLGAALAVIVFLLGEQVLGTAAGVVAAAVVAVGFEPVTHGAELRAYELLAVLSPLLALVLVRELRAPRRSLDLALAATVLAGLLTHYYFVYAALVALAWTWVEPRARPIRRRVTVAFAAGAALASPWLPAFAAQYRHDHFWWIGPFSLRVVLVTPMRQVLPYGVHHLVLGLAIVGIFGLGAALLARRSPEARLLAALAIVPIVVTGALWAGGMRTYDARNLIETAPFLALAGAAACLALPKRTAAPAAAAALAVVASVSIGQSTLPPPPFARLANDLVAEGWRASDPIAVFGNFFTYRAPLEWYLPHAPLLDVSRPDGRGCPSVFVIAPRRALRPLAGVREKRLANGFLVERVDGITARTLAHATLLATSASAPACVRLSKNPRLEPVA
jgi:4-amino-4-deoxy-L-arabinose transferase-like glycosyltransferase